MAPCYRLAVSATIAIAFGVAAPRTLRAQAAELPRSSWAVEGGFGDGTTASLLKFRSPSAAWLLTFDGSFRTMDVETQGTEDNHQTYYAINARAGIRSYRDTNGSLRPFTSLGLLGGIAHSSAGGGSSTSAWNAGAFFELGGSYMLSSHFSLGGAGEINAQYTRQSFSNENPLGSFDSHANGFLVNVGRIRFLATVYF